MAKSRLKALILFLFVAVFTCFSQTGVVANGAKFIRIALQLEPPGLDPTEGASAPTDEVVSGSIYETLVGIDKNGALYPLLAKSYIANQQKTEFTFDLQQNVKFHDGTPFNADSVIFTYNKAKAPESKNVQTKRFGNIDKIEKLSDHQIRIILKKPDSGFVEFLAGGDADIISPQSAKTNATKPIGTGPFKFVEWKQGEYIRLIRNDDYWRGKAKVPGLEFRFIADASAAKAAVVTGAIDLFTNYPSPETFKQLSQDKNLVTRTGISDGEVIMALNNRIAPLNNLKVRQALAMALDKKAIVNGAMNGYGELIGSHYSPARSGYLDLNNVYPHNIAKAKELLTEAGYKNGFTLTLDLPPPVYARRSGEIVALQLANIGIKVKINQIEWPNWLDKVYSRKDFQATIISHAEPYDFYAYNRPEYYYGYADPNIGKLFEGLEKAQSVGERNTYLAEIQTKIAKDVPNVFLFEHPILWVENAKISDAFLNSPYQGVDFFNISIADDGVVATKTSGINDWVKWGGIGAIVLLFGYAFYNAGAGFLTRKILFLIVGLFAGSFLIFFITNVLPGDPARFILGLDASEEAVKSLRTELGLDAGLFTRFFNWIGGLLRGDFGSSFIYKSDIREIILQRLSLSLPLALLALLISTIVGITIGSLIYFAKNYVRTPILTTLEGVISIPNYVIAIGLVYLIYVVWGAKNFGQFAGWNNDYIASLKVILPPALAAGISQGAIIAKIFYEQLQTTAKESFVLAARGKGYDEGHIFRNTIFPNSIAPALGVLSLQFPYLIGGTAVLEAIFALPGLGSLALNAVSSRDLPILQNVVLIMVAIVMVSNLFFEIFHKILDPRVNDKIGGR